MHAPADTNLSIRLDGPRDRSLLAIADALRANHFPTAEPKRQKDFGQYLTSPHVADLMASMFRMRASRIRLLDAGAGMGILSAAFVHWQLQKKVPPKRIEVTAYEVDAALISGLEETYEACRIACQQRGVEFSASIRNLNFIVEAAEMQRQDFFLKRHWFSMPRSSILPMESCPPDLLTIAFYRPWAWKRRTFIRPS